ACRDRKVIAQSADEREQKTGRGRSNQLGGRILRWRNRRPGEEDLELVARKPGAASVGAGSPVNGELTTQQAARCPTSRPRWISSLATSRPRSAHRPAPHPSRRTPPNGSHWEFGGGSRPRRLWRRALLPDGG